jgi:hypothetical protein
MVHLHNVEPFFQLFVRDKVDWKVRGYKLVFSIRGVYQPLSMVRFNPLLGITPASNMVFAVNGYQQMLVSRNFDVDYFDLLVGKRFYIIGLLIAIKCLVVFYILAQVIA